MNRCCQNTESPAVPGFLVAFNIWSLVLQENIIKFKSSANEQIFKCLEAIPVNIFKDSLCIVS